VGSTERRRRRRFNIALGLRYSVPVKNAPALQGEGFTENISSSGLLFRSSSGALAVGTFIAINLDWPRPAEEGDTIRLSMSGRVIRADPPDMAVVIGWHGFQREREPEVTAAKAPAAARHGNRAPVLVVGADPLYRFVAAMLSRYEYPVIHLDLSTAMDAVNAKRKIGLLITNQVEGMEAFHGRVPILYTGDAGELADYPSEVMVLEKPYKYRSFHAMVKRVLEL